MKIIIGLLILAACAMSAAAQDAKAIVELASGAEKIVKNSPFSADAVSESVQTLADGNRIVRSSTSKLYRNSEGRFRREIAKGSGGVAGTIYSYGGGITILDPVVGFRYQLDSHLMTARQAVLRAITARDLKLREGTAPAEAKEVQAQKLIAAEKLNAEIKASTAAAPVAAGTGTTLIRGDMPSAAFSVAGGGMVYQTLNHTKYETRVEKLGMQNIEGVEAEGTRKVTTIPAGAIGNERPIEIVYESWYSNELQMVVLSKNNDPRIGEQTYRLTNITRAEPDPSLFTLPSGYRLITEPGAVYKVATAPAKAVAQRATTIKPAAAASPVMVSNKP